MFTKTQINLAYSVAPARLVFFAGPEDKEAPPPVPEKTEADEIAELKKALENLESNKQDAVDKFKAKFKNFQELLLSMKKVIMCSIYLVSWMC